VQGPARVVHGDYTLNSAPQRLRDLAAPPSMNDTLRTFLSQGERYLRRTRSRARWKAAASPLSTYGATSPMNRWRTIPWAFATPPA
jgi:hypothetical protein